jgi:hypothetical protein
MIFSIYLSDFSYFPLEKNPKVCRTWSEKIKKGPVLTTGSELDLQLVSQSSKGG